MESTTPSAGLQVARLASNTERVTPVAWSSSPWGKRSASPTFTDWASAGREDDGAGERGDEAEEQAATHDPRIQARRAARKRARGAPGS